MTSVVVEHTAQVVDLHGYGQVGRALRQRLERAHIAVASVTTRRGVLEQHDVHGGRVFVDATAPAYSGPAAEKWIATIEATLRSGTPVVTANKAPLALAWDRIERAAQAGKTTLSCSATVGGGTPVLHLLNRIRLAHGITKIEALLSGTLTYILGRLAEGTTLADAIRDAQHAGYAEPDPTLDVDGTDAFAKAIILHNRLFPEAKRLRLEDRREKLVLDEKAVAAHRAAGRIPQVIATIEPGHAVLRLEGRPHETALLGPPVNCVVHATTVDGAPIRLTGPGAGPGVTAGAILADLIALRERAPGLPGGILP